MSDMTIMTQYTNLSCVSDSLLLFGPAAHVENAEIVNS